MTATLRVVQAGNTRYQDLGRIGAERIGLSINGALDPLSAACANILVGNPRGHPLLELTRFDTEFEALADTLVALTGAAAALTVDGIRRPNERPVPVRAGQRLAVRDIHDGMRSYLALTGGIDAARLAGSVAADPIVGFPQRLADGDIVSSRSDYRDFTHPEFVLPLFEFAVPSPRDDSRRLPDGSRAWLIDVTSGTDTAELADPHELTTPFQVGALSDHVGLRLEGASVRRTSARELVSRGVPVGGIELLATGELIALQRGRYVTAGYPVVAVVGRGSLPALGQAAPGDELRFRWRDTTATVARYRADLARVDALERHVDSAFQAAGLLTHRSRRGTRLH